VLVTNGKAKTQTAKSAAAKKTPKAKPAKMAHRPKDN
jgi:hypothetical protein